MVAHEYISMNSDSEPLGKPAEPFQKMAVGIVVRKNQPAFRTSDDDMIPTPGISIGSGRAIRNFYMNSQSQARQNQACLFPCDSIFCIRWVSGLKDLRRVRKLKTGSRQLSQYLIHYAGNPVAAR
jgi:hypothetical protein